MTMLVTLQQGKDHLEMDHDLSDALITAKIEQASAAVLRYLKSNAMLYVDTSGEPIGEVPADIQAATLLMLGELFKNREPSNDASVPAQWGYGYLPGQVVSLLYSYRTPTVQ